MHASPEGQPVSLPVRESSGYPRAGRFRRWLRRISVAWLIISMVLAGLAVSPVVDTWVAAMDCQQPLEKARYILCLGGDPYRVLEGATLLREGWGEVLVVSNQEGAAELMRHWAIGWGVPPDRIVVDNRASCTREHPASIAAATGLDPAVDVCLVVTDYSHLARSQACFRAAGYRRLVMREPRWTRSARGPRPYRIKSRLQMVPDLLYEGAAWVEYWLRGAV